MCKFRQLLPTDFNDLSILQYLEFGFPLGLIEDYVLQPVLKNHSSSYEYFTHVDKFISNELSNGGLTGPFSNSPFSQIMTSPLMTAVKKPNSRRSVFDASFGDHSLNLNTPEKCYLGEDYLFSFPKLDDFATMILTLGQGCFMWKRDLSRFFLQLPIDPIDYNKLACIWRGQLLFFTSYVWGCRHAGMNGQRVTTAVSQIHRSLGLSTSCTHKEDGCGQLCSHKENVSQPQLFNTLNYSDDFAGVELSLERADLSFNVMSSLLCELGLAESVEKAVSPCHVMTHLGIELDSIQLEMRVDQRKCAELRLELEHWCRRTVANKSEIQSILGKLMWIARAVKFSRSFVLRIIAEVKKLSSQKQKTTLSNCIRKDLLWWKEYLLVFNGVELLVPDHVSVQVAGDACPMGLGSWNPDLKEYFSTLFPFKLQDPQIPIHIKEFICVILAVKLWGKHWAGKRCEILCDNDAVCDVITNMKPKNSEMQKYLREFLFWVCKFNFHPVVSKIGTKENSVADFLSRNFNEDDAETFFSKEGISPLKKLVIYEEHFELKADW